MADAEANMVMMFLLVGGVVVLISGGLLVWMFMKSNQVNLTGKTEDKPEWMRAMPPVETVNATRAEGKGVTLYDFDEGEHLAAPFAEQIEDILRAKLGSEPAFKDVQIDFGTSPDGALEIWVNGEKFESLDKLPDEKLKQMFRLAVKEWNQTR